MSDLKPCHCGDPYEQHVLTENGTYCVLCARRALERSGRLESAVRKVCEEIREAPHFVRHMTKFHGVDVLIDDKLADWADTLERAMEGK